MKKFFKLGTHLELLKPGIALDSVESLENKYVSSVHDVVDEDTILITNPTKKSRLVSMHVGEKYDCYIFVNGKIFKTRVVVRGHKNDRNLRVVEVELLSNIVKYERRQFFRLDVAVDIRYLLLTANNMLAFKEAVKKNELLSMEGFVTATTRDISGGGIRFGATENLPKDSMLIINMEAVVDERPKQYVFLGKVLSCEKHEEARGMYDVRIQFVDLKQSAREELVQYIFQCEREQLKKHNS